MGIQIKPSDLYYKYKHKKETREQPKFTGKPDPNPFDRDDLYDVIAMMEAVMDDLGCRDSGILEQLEEIMIYQMPGFIASREEVFDFLTAVAKERLGA